MTNSPQQINSPAQHAGIDGRKKTRRIGTVVQPRDPQLRHIEIVQTRREQRRRRRPILDITIRDHSRVEHSLGHVNRRPVHQRERAQQSPNQDCVQHSAPRLRRRGPAGDLRLCVLCDVLPVAADGALDQVGVRVQRDEGRVPEDHEVLVRRPRCGHALHVRVVPHEKRGSEPLYVCGVERGRFGFFDGRCDAGESCI